MDCRRQGWGFCISVAGVTGAWCIQVEYDMHEICNEGEGGCLDTDDKWGEGFPRNKWMSDCTEDGKLDHQWGTDSDTVNTLLTSHHQRARNPQVLQEQVCPQ